MRIKTTIFILVLFLVCILLTGCSSSTVTDYMGERFETIEEDGCVTLCYDKETNAVYIVYRSIYLYGISPYIMFDEFGQPTVGKWNGKEINVERLGEVNDS